MTTHDSFCAVWISVCYLWITFELIVSMKDWRNKGIVVTRWVFLMCIDGFCIYELTYRFEIGESILSKSMWGYLLMIAGGHFFYSVTKFMKTMADGTTSETNN